MGFERFDKSDYDWFADHSVWSTGGLANLIVNIQKTIDGSFKDLYWKTDAEEDWFSLLSNTFLEWHEHHGLKVYGPQGDYTQPLTDFEQYLRASDELVYLDPQSAFFLKRDCLHLIEKLDGEAYKRLKTILSGKPIKEDSVDLTEEELFKINAKWLLAYADENNLEKPSKKGVIEKIAECGIGVDRSQSTQYKWLEEYCLEEDI